MEELLRCPFCGGEAELNAEQYHPAMSACWVIRCLECFSHGAVLNSPDGAIKAWNRRVTQNIGKKECCEQNEEQEG